MRLFLALLALLACLGAGAYGLLRAGGDSPAAPIEASIADAHFVFASAHARDEATAAGGLRGPSRLCRGCFPTFAPPARAAKAQSSEALTSLARNHVFITVSLKDDGVDPADRPMQLYARFLEAETIAGPGGLVMRRFEQGSPYDLEHALRRAARRRDVFRPLPKTFARAARAPTELCFFGVRVDGLDVELRFAPRCSTIGTR